LHKLEVYPVLLRSLFSDYSFSLIPPNYGFVMYLSNKMERKESPQFLPFEKAAIVLNGVKLTTDIGTKVQCQLGKEEAECSTPNLAT
jgi:hypothetical protein